MADVLFGDIEEALIDGIQADLAPTPVRTHVPSPRPAAFVTIQRLGGVDTSVVTEDATVTVESWALRDRDAHDTAQLARYLIHQLVGRTLNTLYVYRVQEFAGPARLPDPISGQSRWTFTVSVRVRGTSI